MTTISNYDYTVLIDFSGSMASTDTGKVGTRIQRVKESLTGLVSELAAVDEDGIDVITFGGELIQHTPGVKDSSIIETIFSGRRVAGGTPTAEALTKAFEVAGKSDKPDFLVVFTDGEPNNREAVKTVIRNQANEQANDANEQANDADLTILFIQVGDDASAGDFLKDLDDNLNAKLDIVDVKTQAEADAFPTLSALIDAAING